MASVLDFERYHADLNRQLLRRIGYTNGLHRIRRFARVVDYVYSVMPTSISLLVQIVIKEENEFVAKGSSGRPLSGKKYAQGIIDVAQALTLLEKFGPRIALSSQGYACHALSQIESEKAIDTFLLEKVIAVDGEYTLNILRIIDEGLFDVLAVGQELATRFLDLIRFKVEWAESLSDRFSQRVLRTALSDAEQVFRKSVENSKTADFFFRHTVNPRIEWLTDLGCIQSDEDGRRLVQPSGRMILQAIRRLGGWKDHFVFLPFDSWLTSQLSMPNLYQDQAAEDFSWVLAASRYSAHPTKTGTIEPLQLLEEIRSIYPHVKLANFNEADALSVYEVLAAIHATNGLLLSERDFEEALTNLTSSFPGEVFKLSKRRGRGQYVALKNPVGSPK